MILGPIKLALRLAVGALVVLVAYVGVTFAQVRAASERDEARPADAIVVFGAAQFNGRPSAVLRARLDHAADLYRRRLAPVVWVTGGRQPGDRFTEAATSASYLIERGIPEKRIKREVQGRSSWDSLASTAAYLKAAHAREVVLVSDPFHSYRIKAMAGELGLDGHASPTRTSPIVGGSARRHMLRETVAVAIGRVIGYRREAGVKRVSRSVQDRTVNG